MTGDQPYGAGGDARTEAADRVDAASAERSRLRNAHERARGTSNELQADTSLRAANGEFAARERWLQWVEDSHY